MAALLLRLLETSGFEVVLRTVLGIDERHLREAHRLDIRLKFRFAVGDSSETGGAPSTP